MTATSSLTSSAAGRYATALFELAKAADEGKGKAAPGKKAAKKAGGGAGLEAVEADLAAFRATLEGSEDLRYLVASPVHSREDQGRALTAVADAMGLGRLVKNTLGLMAANRRLFALDRFLDAFDALMAAHRGEVSAEIATARKLTADQTKKLADGLKAATGRAVKLTVAVDESLIGGLVVTVGSRMVDTSIRAKLANLQNTMLQNAMKEA